MSENSDRRLLRSGQLGSGTSGSAFNAKEKLKVLFSHIGGRPFAKRSTARTHKSDLLGRGSWLNYCCDRAIDAHTLHEALRWQTRVVDALSGIIETISARDWPAERKRKVLFELMHERARHNGYIVNIEAALRRRDSVEWTVKAKGKPPWI